MQATPRLTQLDQPALYLIKIQGRLDAGWSAWFDDLAITVNGGNGEPSVTTLTGPVKDQAALHGLLTRIRDLGLPILLVQYLGRLFTIHTGRGENT